MPREFEESGRGGEGGREGGREGAGEGMRIGRRLKTRKGMVSQGKVMPKLHYHKYPAAMT